MKRMGCGFANDSFLAHDCPSLYRLFTLPVHVDSIPEGRRGAIKCVSMLNCRKIYNMTHTNAMPCQAGYRYSANKCNRPSLKIDQTRRDSFLNAHCAVRNARFPCATRKLPQEQLWKRCLDQHPPAQRHQKPL